MTIRVPTITTTGQAAWRDHGFEVKNVKLLKPTGLRSIYVTGRWPFIHGLLCACTSTMVCTVHAILYNTPVITTSIQNHIWDWITSNRIILFNMTKISNDLNFYVVQYHFIVICTIWIWWLQHLGRGYPSKIQPWASLSRKGITS